MKPNQYIPMQLPKAGVIHNPAYVKINTESGDTVYIPLPIFVEFTETEEETLPGGRYITIAKNVEDFDSYESDNCKSYSVTEEEYKRLMSFFESLTGMIYVPEGVL